MIYTKDRERTEPVLINSLQPLSITRGHVLEGKFRSQYST